ncbi:MAG: magnesium transporter [Gammaproteobacteria bacterium]
MRATAQPPENLGQRLQPILNLLEKHELVESLVDHQDGAPRQGLVRSIVQRQQLSELAAKLKDLHAADIGHLLEMLPPDRRGVVWSQVPEDTGGDVLWDVTEAVAQTLVSETPPERLIAMCRRMDPDDFAQIDHLLPEDVRRRVVNSFEASERRWVEATETYPEDSVGQLMTREMISIGEDRRLGDAVAAVRRLDEFPDQTDMIFVVDARQKLVGGVPLTTLLLRPPETPVADVVDREITSFRVDDRAAEAAGAFERYNLVSAPVVDAKDKLLGRLTVDTMLDFLVEEAEEDVFRREGLRGGEDLMGPVLKSARQRWLWLALNLLTAFAASRVISVFEGTIESLVALATLMPIVASIGGNTGNQTIALFVRGLALEQITPANRGYLMAKELGVAAINGTVWGTVMGLVTAGLYSSPALGMVMGAATLLNLVVAALVGMTVPQVMQHLGYDPALGSSVVLTFMTDSMGFFIFLGLSAAVLVS